MFAQAAVARNRWQCIDGEYWIELAFYRAERRGDWDNFAKAVTDPMSGLAWPDDRQIVEAIVSMYVDRKNPRVEVRVERFPPKHTREG